MNSDHTSKQIQILSRSLDYDFLDSESKRFIEYCISLLEDDNSIGLDRTTALFYAFLTSPVTSRLNKKLDINDEQREELLDLCYRDAHSNLAKEYLLLDRMFKFPLREYFGGKIDIENLIISIIIYASYEPNWVYDEYRLKDIKKALAIPKKIYLNSYDIFYAFENLNLDFLKFIYAISPVNASGNKIDADIAFDITQNMDDHFLKYLADNPQQIHQLNPETFEKLIAKLYEKSGYQVKLISGWNQPDGGVDVLAIKHDDLLGDISIAIQCKKFSKERKVQPSYIRELNGSLERFKADKGILVTTSTFSKKVIEETQNHYYKITLVDYLNLVNILKRILAINEKIE